MTNIENKSELDDPAVDRVTSRRNVLKGPTWWVLKVARIPHRLHVLAA
jgi:hypothetical protein